MSITQAVNSQLLGLDADYRYYAWERNPDWSQGVVFQWKPATGGTIVADASIVPLSAPEDPIYTEVIPSLKEGSTGDAATDNPFEHLRVKGDGQFWIRSTGELVEVDFDGDAV